LVVAVFSMLLENLLTPTFTVTINPLILPFSPACTKAKHQSSRLMKWTLPLLHK